MVRIPCFHGCGLGSKHSQGTKIPQPVPRGQKIKIIKNNTHKIKKTSQVVHREGVYVFVCESVSIHVCIPHMCIFLSCKYIRKKNKMKPTHQT